MGTPQALHVQEGHPGLGAGQQGLILVVTSDLILFSRYNILIPRGKEPHDPHHVYPQLVYQSPGGTQKTMDSSSHHHPIFLVSDLWGLSAQSLVTRSTRLSARLSG